MKESLREASLSNTLEIELNPKLSHTLNPAQEKDEGDAAQGITL